MESRGHVDVSFKGRLPMPGDKKQCPIEAVLEQIKACSFECAGGKLENSAAWAQLIERLRVMRASLETIASGPKTYPDFERSDNHGDSIDYGMALARFNAAQIAREGLR